MSAQTELAKTAGSSAVEVGRIFGEGGTDGLILYALVLSTFLMFLVATAAVWLGYRAIERKTKINADSFAKKDEMNNAQTIMFTESMDRIATTINALSVSIAGNLQESAATAAVLARLEGTDHRIVALLERLTRVD